MNDLDTLVPVARDLTVAGIALAITPLRLGELPAFARAVQPIASALATANRDWLGLIAAHGEAVLASLTIATRRPRKWVDALALDEAVRLAAVVVEVNGDFFVKNVLPALDAHLPAAVGSISPSASSDTATVSPTF